MAAFPAWAQTTTNVPSGTNLSTLTPPANGDVWNLQGNAVLYGATASTGLALPTSGAGLTIDGVAGGSTITLNDGAGHYGFFNNATASPATLNLSNVTITGGLEIQGGAINVLNNGANALTLNTSGTVVFSNNQVTNVGGAIADSDSAALTINASGSLLFSNNVSTNAGGAIIAGGNLALNSSGAVEFSNNKTTSTASGGALYVNGSVTINGSQITIDNNSAGGTAGAIISFTSVSIGNAGSTVDVSGNIAAYDDGAIMSVGGVTIDGSQITLANNKAATGADGAILAYGDVLIGDANSVVAITGNSAVGGNAGAIGSNTNVTINGSQIMVSGNSANGNGGAIYAGGAVTINGALTMNGNQARGSSSIGGGIYANGDVVVNGSVSADSNTASGGGDGGGAIFSAGNVYLATASGNGNVSLTNNSAVGEGGAVSALGNVSIGNAAGTVTLTGNTASTGGGAICSSGVTTLAGSTITLSNNTAGNGGGIYSNGDVIFNGALTMNDNHATNRGGAIYASSGNVIVNGSVSADSNTSGYSGSASTGGGAIYAPGGNVNLATNPGDGNVSLTNNTTQGAPNIHVPYTALAGSGGAIMAGSISVASIMNVSDVSIGNAVGTITIKGNAADNLGGAICSTGATTLTGSGVVSNNAAGIAGGAIWAGGNVTLNALAGSIVFSGNAAGGQANAIYLNNTGGATTTTLNASAFGNNVVFYDPIQNNVANGLVSVVATGTGAVAFDGSLYSNPASRWSQVYGNTEVTSGATFAVQNNAVYGALAADVGGAAGLSSFIVDSGAILAGGYAGEVRANNFAMNGVLNIAGAAAPGNASGGFSTFTVTSGNVNFGSGSQVLFNTYLNDGSVQLTDLLKLNLNGSAVNGTATIRINTVGGGNTPTMGNGIELVDVVGNNGTTAGAFALGSRVAAGVYDYGLYHGSVDNSGPENWYLRTKGIRPEVPLDVVVPALASRLGFTMMGTASDRNGGFYDPPGQCNCADETDDRGHSTQLWSRMFGETGGFGGGGNSGNLGFGGNGPTYNFDFGGVQIGDDLFAHSERNSAGLYFTGATMRANVLDASSAPAGVASMDAYSFGGYWTHRDPNGWYSDLVLALNFYENIRTQSVEDGIFSTQGWGGLASGEMGYIFSYANGYSLIPQGQLLYQHTSINNGADTYSQINYGDTNEVYGRAGLRFAKGWFDADTNNRLLTAYMEANVWHQFSADSVKTTFASMQGTYPTTVAAGLGGTWMQFGVGLTGQLAKNIGVFGSVDYNQEIDQSGHSLGGQMGVTVGW